MFCWWIQAPIVKTLALSKSINVNSAERKNLGGAFGGSAMTQGSVKVKQDLSGVPFKFHLIENNVNQQTECWGEIICGIELFSTFIRMRIYS